MTVESCGFTFLLLKQVASILSFFISSNMQSGPVAFWSNQM